MQEGRFEVVGRKERLNARSLAWPFDGGSALLSVCVEEGARPSDKGTSALLHGGCRLVSDARPSDKGGSALFCVRVRVFVCV